MYIFAYLLGCCKSSSVISQLIEKEYSTGWAFSIQGILYHVARKKKNILISSFLSLLSHSQFLSQTAYKLNTGNFLKMPGPNIVKDMKTG